MRKLLILICFLASFVVAAGNRCYTLGSNLIDKLTDCRLTQSSVDVMDYTCDNGFVFIDKPTGNMTLIFKDSRGKLTLGANAEGCYAELLDEYGVAVIPVGSFPKGNNGRGLYKKFKKKFLSSPVSSVVDSRCPPSWQDYNGVCDPRYFE